MTVNEFASFLNSYQEEVEKTKVERPLTPAELDGIAENVQNIPSEHKEAFNLALQDNFSMFESLPFALRNYLGAKKLQAFREEFGENPSLENEEVRNYLRARTMDAAFRAGVSVEKNSAGTRESAKAIDSFMNTYLMQKTMTPPTEAEKSALAARIGAEGAKAALEQNLQKQRLMAKTLFMAQLGKYEIHEKARLGTNLEEPLSETLAHGSRTNFVLPVGGGTQQVFDAFLGENMGTAAGVNKRTAATHYVKRRTVAPNGLIKSETKESKTYNPFRVFNNQYGMNIATGGIGSKGPDGNAIVGDGESGHVYMRIENGDKKHCGSLLFGIEGSEPGKSNYLGHSHGASGTGAKQSAFFADKQIVGKKTGGRQVDLSGLSSYQLANILNEFDKKYFELQKNANTRDGRDKIAELNDMLMGRLMPFDQLNKMCQNLGIGGKALSNTLRSAREGYLNRVDAAQVDKENFEKEIRKSISQETACYLAEERFRRAENDVNLSVGALKELMLTHETRKLGWRLRHPIKNYREGAMINDLTKRLTTEKRFSAQDIAAAMASSIDTFSMDWGENLSNDQSARAFLEDNSQRLGAYVTNNSVGAPSRVSVQVKQNENVDKERMDNVIRDMKNVLNEKRGNKLDSNKDKGGLGINGKSDGHGVGGPSHGNVSDREPFPISEIELSDLKDIPLSPRVDVKSEKTINKELI